jgi:putative peptidoglycan lipid II flippase
MSASLSKKISIASLIMMASVLASRVIGIFRESVIAYVGGRGVGVDAYQVAFIVPDILNHIVASGFLSLTFIPIFSRYLAVKEETEGWRVFSIISTVFGFFLLALLMVAEVFTPEIIRLAAPGWHDPIITGEAIRMTRIILPAQFFFFTGGLLMAVQFAKERFFLPALAPLIYNVGIILGGLLLGPYLGMVGFAWGVLVGAFLGNFAIQYWGAKKIGMRLFVSFNFRHPDLITYVKITIPLMFGLTMTFSHELFIRFFGSFLDAGSISGLNYANRVMQVLVGVFGQAVGAATYPFLSRMVAQGEMDEANRLLNNTLRYMALIIPVSALVIVLRSEVVAILFQRGKFGGTDTAQTARMLMFMMPGAVAFAAQTLVVRGYYASQNTLFPTIFSSIAVVACLPIYFTAMKWVGPSGIALAGAFSALLQVVLLYLLWNRKSGNKGSKQVFAFYRGMTALGLVLGLLLEWIRTGMYGAIGMDLTSLAGRMAICAGMGSIFLILMAIAGFTLKIEEITRPFRMIAAKFSRS